MVFQNICKLHQAQEVWNRVIYMVTLTGLIRSLCKTDTNCIFQLTYKEFGPHVSRDKPVLRFILRQQIFHACTSAGHGLRRKHAPHIRHEASYHLPGHPQKDSSAQQSGCWHRKCWPPWQEKCPTAGGRHRSHG